MTSKIPFQYKDVVSFRKDLPEPEFLEALEFFDLHPNDACLTGRPPPYTVVWIAKRRNIYYSRQGGVEVIVFPTAVANPTTLPDKPMKLSEVRHMAQYADQCLWLPAQVLQRVYTNTF